MYYEIDLSGPRIIRGPAALPRELVGLAHDNLADLSSALDPCPAEFAGIGYWPGVPVPPAFDAVLQRLSSQMDEVPDPATCTVVVTPLVVNLTPAEISAATQAALAQRVAAIKVEAATRILAIAPEWAQRNLTARAADLALLYPGTKGIDLPEPERSEYLAGQAVWERIRAIRDASNSIEAALAAAATKGASEADVRAVDVVSMWPE